MSRLDTVRSGEADSGGVRIHYLEAGPSDGPVVLLVHGFPELCYSWRHQLPALAEAGYRAVAIDVRGYGRSGKPAAVEEYRMLRHVADNVSVAAHLGADEVVLVGHDWGAPISWTSALVRPDLFSAVALLSVPYAPPGSRRPTEVFAELAGPDQEFYMNYFQEPGRLEAEAEEDLRHFLTGFYYGASGEAPAGLGGAMAFVPRGSRLADRLAPPGGGLSFLSGEDLEVYVAEFERTGLTGGLNRYRNMDRDVEDLAAWRGRPLEVPSLFIGAERDGPTIWGTGAITRFATTLPRLVGSHVLPDCGHWIPQERPGEVNRLLLDFLRAVRPL